MTWTTRPRSEYGDLAAIRVGGGEAVLLLHGVGLRAEAWNAQIDALAEKFDVIAPDMPGHGESTPLEKATALADYSDRVAVAIDRPVWVAGHSMGALIALDLAVRYPDRVRGVAALNAIFRRSDKAAAAVRARAGSLDGVSPVDPSEPLSRWFGDVASPEAAACRTWLGSVDPAGYRTAYTVFAHDAGPSDAELLSLKRPSLFMTGAAEPNSTPAMSEAMARLAPQGRALVVEGAAHMMPMTHPGRVTEALSALFEEGAA